MGDKSSAAAVVAPPRSGYNLQIPEYTTNMAAPPNSSQGPGLPMSMTQSGLPALAPAPPPPHPATIQTTQIPQMHTAQPGSAPVQSMAGQPMQLQQNMAGQPQFIIQQPAFASGQQYTTLPQFAYTNQQGQLILQPAPQFSLPGQPGQPQGQQQVIFTNVQQKPGQQQVMVSTPGQAGKPGQPTYTITSSGPIQMQGAQPGQQPQAFMITNPMGQNFPGQVTMSAPNGQPPMIPTSMTNIKGADGKTIAMPQNQMNPGPGQQQFVIPSPGMTYMQTPGAHPHIIQNGQQLIFRTPGPHEQQVMFSPSGQAAPQQAPQQLQPQTTLQPGQIPANMQMQTAPRPQNPVGPPPGKTAISRAIAPLPTTVTQSTIRAMNPNAGQPSPKSKQKMSPRGGANGVGRPPVPKGGQMKMLPRMAAAPVTMQATAPNIPSSIQTPIPRAQLPVQPVSQQGLITGPPTLSPMIGGAPSVPAQSGGDGVQMSAPTFTTAQSFPQIPAFSTVPTYSTAVPLTTVTSVLGSKPIDGSIDPPPTLTKEIIPPMPNLGQPNTTLTRPALISKSNETTESVPPPVISTPKAVVKPQVLTHVIDGHIIKESSQPFPVSPVKATARRKSEKGDDAKNTNGGVKRGPGRPPGSNKQNHDINKNGSIEPAEKKMKVKDDCSTAVTYPAVQQPVLPAVQQQLPPPPQQVSQPLLQQQQAPPAPPSQQQAQPTSPAPPQPPKQQPSLLSTLKGNPLKWNVTEVCDFIKSLPGCGEYVDDFAQQEIDGQALMLLKADHLMSAMSIKLGPALKICRHLDQIREEMARQ